VVRDHALTVPFGPANPRLARVGAISTYPPTHCGIATFSAALVRQFRSAGHSVDVVALDDGKNNATVGGSVIALHRNDAPGAVRATAHTLRRCDIVVIQHEFGIFGGEDGDEILDLMDAIGVPVVVVAHTVPLTPTRHQHHVLVEVCARAERVVVMTEAARDRLVGSYPVDADTIVTIPHGAAAPVHQSMGTLVRTAAVARPQLLTWGLLGPGKGIEHVIDALAILHQSGEAPHYTVSGVTHPNVLLHHGDGYRQGLIRQVQTLGLTGRVTFDATYRTVEELTRFVASSSVVVLPYDSRDQVTSGVLVDAIAAGRPLIATAFPHAVELLATGAGIVVPHGDVQQLAEAIRTVVQRPDIRHAMAVEASRLAPGLLWPNVARTYLTMFDELCHTAHAVAM
jgi:glycosyltransferase involved in cell wall biosynthesis